MSSSTSTGGRLYLRRYLRAPSTSASTALSTSSFFSPPPLFAKMACAPRQAELGYLRLAHSGSHAERLDCHLSTFAVPRNNVSTSGKSNGPATAHESGCGFGTRLDPIPLENAGCNPGPKPMLPPSWVRPTLLSCSGALIVRHEARLDQVVLDEIDEVVGAAIEVQRRRQLAAKHVWHLDLHVDDALAHLRAACPEYQVAGNIRPWQRQAY